jgi:hypothetical protein
MSECRAWGESDMNITEIVRRSSLIMPVNQPRFVEKAYLRGKEARKAEALRLAGVA